MTRTSPSGPTVASGLLWVALASPSACGGERAGYVNGNNHGAVGGGRVAMQPSPDATMAGAIVDGGAETGPLDLWYRGPETGPPPDAFGVSVGPPLECDGGYYIELTDDAGTRSYRSTCVGSDAAVRTRCTFCAEDNFSAILEACSGTSWIVVEVADPHICFASGTRWAFVSYDDGDGGIISGFGGVTFAREPTWFRGCVPSNGGPTVGEFGAYVGSGDAGSTDGGVGAPMKGVSGRFCLDPLGTL